MHVVGEGPGAILWVLRLLCLISRLQWHPTPVFLPGESQGRGAKWTAVYGVAQSRTRLKRLSSSSSSSKTLYNLIWSPHPDFNLALGTLPLSLEKEMATSSSILAWKVPWTEEPGGLQFMGSQSDTAERLSTLFFYRAGTVTLLQLKLLRKRLCWLPTNHWALNWQLHWHGHWQLS